MPAVSFYLPDDLLMHLKAKAKAARKSVSSIIRQSVEQHLDVEDKRSSKEALIRLLRDANLGTWEKVYGERERDHGK